MRLDADARPISSAFARARHPRSVTIDITRASPSPRPRLTFLLTPPARSRDIDKIKAFYDAGGPPKLLFTARRTSDPPPRLAVSW